MCRLDLRMAGVSVSVAKFGRATAAFVSWLSGFFRFRRNTGNFGMQTTVINVFQSVPHKGLRPGKGESGSYLSRMDHIPLKVEDSTGQALVKNAWRVARLSSMSVTAI